MEVDVVDVEGLVVRGDGTAVMLCEADVCDIGGNVQFFKVISDIFPELFAGSYSSQM